MSLYLMVFGAFGLLVSALTHRRLTAFLGLLGLWTIWLFVVPNLAIRASRAVHPAESLYSLKKKEGTFGDVMRKAGYETYHESKRGNTAREYHKAFEHSKYQPT